MSSPIRLGNVTADTVYVAGISPFADVFAADLTANADCSVRMTVAVSAAVNIFRNEGGTNIDINAGLTMGAEEEQTFLFDMARDETFNIRFSANCTIRKLTVFEIDTGVV